MKYVSGESIYTWFFNMSGELKYHKAIIENYEYMDGMQWEVIDTYKCYYLKPEKKFYIFTKHKRNYIRVQGHMIHKDKLTAKIIFLQSILKKFEINTSTSEELKVIINYASNTLSQYLNKYPEKILAALQVSKITDSSDFSIWR